MGNQEVLFDAIPKMVEDVAARLREVDEWLENIDEIQALLREQVDCVLGGRKLLNAEIVNQQIQRMNELLEKIQRCVYVSDMTAIEIAYEPRYRAVNDDEVSKLFVDMYGRMRHLDELKLGLGMIKTRLMAQTDTATALGDQVNSPKAKG